MKKRTGFLFLALGALSFLVSGINGKENIPPTKMKIQLIFLLLIIRFVETMKLLRQVKIVFLLDLEAH